jgi:hypothetical protein
MTPQHGPAAWKFAVAAVVAVALTPVGAATGAVPKSAVPKWAWSEARAEAALTSNVRLPCLRVRNANGCSMSVLVKQIAETQQQELDECAWLADRWGKQRSDACFAYYAAQPRADSKATLAYIREGFPIAAADCAGARGDGTGRRFSQLRCKVTVVDTTETAPPVTRVERVMVVVTGKTMFRWKLISP